MMTERIPQSVRGAIYLAHCALHGKKAQPERLEGMELHRRLTPAILAYEGIQYSMPST